MNSAFHVLTMGNLLLPHPVYVRFSSVFKIYKWKKEENLAVEL